MATSLHTEPGPRRALVDSSARCLVCASAKSFSLGRWDHMPLSVLHLPRTAEDARSGAQLVLDVRCCAACGHVYHAEFDYDHVGYGEGSNLVYNQGAHWSEYLDALAHEWQTRFELDGKTIVEIGCADGRFLERFAEGNRCIGYEPGPDAERCPETIEVVRDVFDGARLTAERPDAVICRHVLEHLDAPRDLLEDLAFNARLAGLRPWVLAEVPMIDKALAQGRAGDFLYEHVSNFTYDSFRKLFELAGYDVHLHEPRYDDEVVVIAARPRAGAELRASWRGSSRFRAAVRRQERTLRTTLEGWRSAGRRVALWGATGKGAALINMFGIDTELAPLVIDSDLRKVDAHVPGSGQRIQGPAALVQERVDTVLICTNWRARDIEREIREVHGSDAELFVCLNGEVQRLDPGLAL